MSADVLSKPQPPRYRTTNWPKYNRALERRGSMLMLIDPQMQWLAEPAGRMGRPMVFTDVAIHLCLSVKVLFKLPLRQAVGMVQALLKLAGLDWPVPDYTTLCRRQKTLAVQIPYRRVDGPLNLLVDSTGIKFLGDGEWHARKHGPSRRRQWRKDQSAGRQYTNARPSSCIPLHPLAQRLRQITSGVEYSQYRDRLGADLIDDQIRQARHAQLPRLGVAPGTPKRRELRQLLRRRHNPPIDALRRNGIVQRDVVHDPIKIAGGRFGNDQRLQRDQPCFAAIPAKTSSAGRTLPPRAASIPDTIRSICHALASRYCSMA